MLTKGFFFCFLFLFTPERGIFEVELFEIVLAVSEEVSNEEDASPLGAEDHVPMHDKSANKVYKLKISCFPVKMTQKNENLQRVKLLRENSLILLYHIDTVWKFNNFPPLRFYVKLSFSNSNSSKTFNSQFHGL